jgi:hypothetical protein
MKLSDFNVVHARSEAAQLFDDPLIHCFARKQVVLAYVSREALMDYFRIPGERRITLAQWSLVVARHLDDFKPIIEGKFERDEWEFVEKHGHHYPRIVVTLEDIRQSGAQLTIDVFNLDAGFRPRS